MTVAHAGQRVRFRHGRRWEYVRLINDLEPRTNGNGTFVTVYGYRTRADGNPTHVRPVARVLFVSQVEVVSTGSCRKRQTEGR